MLLNIQIDTRTSIFIVKSYSVIIALRFAQINQRMCVKYDVQLWINIRSWQQKEDQLSLRSASTFHKSCGWLDHIDVICLSDRVRVQQQNQQAKAQTDFFNKCADFGCEWSDLCGTKRAEDTQCYLCLHVTQVWRQPDPAPLARPITPTLTEPASTPRSREGHLRTAAQRSLTLPCLRLSDCGNACMR